MSKEFVDYLASLAQEGETFLVVEQKPLKPLQYYKDGGIKCVWPAYLPHKYKPGIPIYGNTGAYIIERFVDGKPSASIRNIEYVLLLILDDIGTKSKTPPLEPTWKMETSPGNYQWGYVFSIQPHYTDFSAAILAIAAAGYTDPGAINPVRNFRLPGSVNIKPENGNFQARLVEFKPEREFTLENICAALGVVPGPADTARQPIPTPPLLLTLPVAAAVLLLNQ